jgi:EAL domain-containing protein (putative c-di-GMP-specific phosphodiesterase class I)
VLLEDVPDAGLAVKVAERIADRMEAPIMLDGRQLTVTLSIGIAVTDGLDATSEDVLAQADVALYAAKDRGKAQYRLFEPPMRERAWTRFELETDLRLALDRGQLAVHYQPVIDLRSGQVRNIEALVRWHHPERGMIAPSTFIPLAERAGFIGPLGNRVLEDACRQIRDWQSRFPSEQPLSVSVNVSARQIHDGKLADRVAGILAETGLAPAHLKLELTESTMMLDTDATDSTLRDLADLGVGILVDDFGTGFSALHYFKRLRLQGLKIDRSFVHGLGRSRSDTAIISAAIAFARALDLTVTAEGIENDEQLRRLRELGCDLGQGFHLVRPLSADLLEGLLREMPRTARQERNGHGRRRLERTVFAAT